ncbi:hypothetical protein ABZZ37_12150 [Streptomyces sp. NPDC006464]|uniref:hypothetical protein n=1 Tax=unclassified Streptomyces TaxID=2593676 RepID=UPI0033BE2543
MAAEFGEESEDLLRDTRCETEGGLVGDEEGGRALEQRSEREQLLLAAGHSGDRIL